MERKLIIEDFGKIKKAEIEISPLTLFVGDNNSGKSYLLSLIWAIYAADTNSVIFRDVTKLLPEEYSQLCQGVYDCISKVNEGEKQEITIPSGILVEILNKLLERNKNKFVAGIFNSEQVTIGKLVVTLEPKFEVTIKVRKAGDGIDVSYMSEQFETSFRVGFSESVGFTTKVVFSDILMWLLKGNIFFYSRDTVYLPAARTGFMLAKNVINRVGRQVAYDVIDFQEQEEIQPFTKPIIHFLNMLEGLNLDHETEYSDIIEWMETAMAHGRIQYGNELNGKEIRYLPEGSEASLPLRTTSAVVTELTPLLLLLKYRRSLKAICYEEPEMCLHPGLQQEMGKLLVRLVNHGLSMIATTHSDIIVQHINNMCRLKEMDASGELLEKLGLTEEDVISLEKVSIYQFTDLGEYSAVEKLIPIDGQFQVRTFSNALMEILEQTSEIQSLIALRANNNREAVGKIRQWKNDSYELKVDGENAVFPHQKIPLDSEGNLFSGSGIMEKPAYR